MKKSPRYLPGNRDFDPYYMEWDEAKSQKETEEIMKQFERAMTEGISESELIDPSLSRPKSASAIKKQSVVGSMNSDAETIFKVGDIVTHIEHGRGMVLSCVREGSVVKMSVEYENGEFYDYEGTPEDVINTFGKVNKGSVKTKVKSVNIENIIKEADEYNPGDIVKVKNQEIEYTVVETTPEGKVRVKDEIGEDKIVDPEYVEKKAQSNLEKNKLVDELVELWHNKKVDLVDVLNIKPGIHQGTVETIIRNKLYNLSDNDIVDLINTSKKAEWKKGSQDTKISIKKWGQEEFSVDKYEESKEEMMENEVKENEEVKSPSYSIWRDVIKTVLLEPETSKRIVEKLVDKIESNPEILVSLSSKIIDQIDRVIPEDFMLKSSSARKDILLKIEAIITRGEDAPLKELYDIEFGKIVPKKPEGLKETRPEVIKELESELRENARKCIEIEQQIKELEEQINTNRKEALAQLEEELKPDKEKLAKLNDKLTEVGQELGTLIRGEGVEWRRYGTNLMIIINKIVKEKRQPPDEWKLKKVLEIVEEMGVNIDEVNDKLKKAINGYSTKEIVEHIKRIWFMPSKEGVKLGFSLSSIFRAIESIYNKVRGWIEELLGIKDEVGRQIEQIEEIIE